MSGALQSYLDEVWRSGDAHQATVAAAEAVAAEPWRVVQEAGRLARCRLEVADRDLGLTAGLAVRVVGGAGAVVTVPRGAPYPRLDHVGRRARGAFDTPLEMARRVVAATRGAARRPLRTALDPACGAGVFLVALAEAGVPEIHGTDLDPLALAVARIAVPKARLAVADGLRSGPRFDLVVGNPPFVPPERQDKDLRLALRRRFPWLAGRFDLAVPFAAVAVERCEPDGAVGLVLPLSATVQPYGATFRRRLVARHRIVDLSGPHPFPGASVEVALLVVRVGDGPGALPVYGITAEELLRLDNCPLDPDLMPGDVDLLEAIRGRSDALGELCEVDTGVVAHGPHGSKDVLLHDEPGPGRVPFADARGFFEGRHRWLDYQPDRMHRAKRPALFERPKIVVQRVRGRGRPVKAAIDRDGVYVGHTCTVVVPRDDAVPLERLLGLLQSPLVDGMLRIERGGRLDLYPRDVAMLPVPRAWLTEPDMPLAEAYGLDEQQVDRLERLAQGA